MYRTSLTRQSQETDKMYPMESVATPRASIVFWFSEILSRREITVVIMGLGLALRFLYLVLFGDRPLMSDSASYNTVAMQLVNGTPFVPSWPPGVPLYLAAVHQLFGDSELVLRVSMLVLYAILSFFAYQTAVLFTGRTAAGNLVLLALALSPAAIFGSAETMTEIPSALLLMIVAYCLLRAESGPSTRNILLLGIALAFLCLTRASSLVLLVLVPPYLIWRTRRVSGAVTVLILGIVMIGTWISYVHSKTGRFVKINTYNSMNFYLGNNPDTPLYRTWWLGGHHEWQNAQQDRPDSVFWTGMDPLARDAKFSQLALQHIRQRPDLFLVRTINRICVFFSFNMYAGAYMMLGYGVPKLPGFAILAFDAALYILTAAGAILYLCTLSGSKEQTFKAWILSVLAFLYAFPYFIALSHPRMHFPIEPILMVLCAAFLVSLLNESDQSLWEMLKRRKNILVTALVILGLVQIEWFIMMADRISQ